MRNFVTQSIVSNLLRYLKKETSAGLVKVTYETIFGCEELMKTFRMVCKKSIETRKKNQRLLF